MPWPAKLFLAEGHAVGALVNGRIGLVGAYQNFVQRAVVCILAMIGALLNSTLNALIGMTVHFASSFIGDVLIMTQRKQNILPILSYKN